MSDWHRVSGFEVANLMNKAFMLHVFSLPVGSAGVAVVILPALSPWGLAHL